jgi:hypothetical protein
MYISSHPEVVGICANNVAFPWQSMLLMFLKGTPVAVQ